MRILIIAHPPLSLEVGAGQTALQLAAALRARGHNVEAWSCASELAGARWWNLWRLQRRAIERRVSGEQFDVIDSPAITASPVVAAHCQRLVARSVQPELQYLFGSVRDDLVRNPSPRSIVHALLALPRAAAIVGGWRRATRILCLGSRELDWMRRRFPTWSEKLAMYVSAPPHHDREMLANVKRMRQPRPPRHGIRYLWMGRWSALKGTTLLLRFVHERLVPTSQDTLTIAGCGELALSEIPTQALADQRVRVVGEYSRDRLPELLRGHDAGLFTSRIEGWGLTLVEMLESGLPVYATDAGAVVDLAPYFPHSLRSFPPTSGALPDFGDNPSDNGYFERFNWESIAGSYEAMLLGRDGRRSTGAPAGTDSVPATPRN